MNIKSEILQSIPGVGKSISQDLKNIGITKVSDLHGKTLKSIYDASNKFT